MNPSTIELDQLDAFDSDTNLLNVVIEASKGSRCKYKYDSEMSLFRLSKLLPLGAAFPYDFGFVPSTAGDDGDPLDILVLSDEPLSVGCVVPVRLIGVIEAEQSDGSGQVTHNNRFLGVIETPYNPPDVRSLDQLNRQRLDEIEHFFVSYNIMEQRDFRPIARHGPTTAARLIKQGKERAEKV